MSSAQIYERFGEVFRPTGRRTAMATDCPPALGLFRDGTVAGRRLRGEAELAV